MNAVAALDHVRLVGDDVSLEEMESALQGWLQKVAPDARRVLLLPPDFTRGHAQAGPIVRALYRMLSPGVQVDIMPALGTHVPLTDEERIDMFGEEVPAERFLVHNWRTDVVQIGEVPASFVKEVSEGQLDYAIEVEVNRRLLDPSYDLIVSIGQVVPHEVVGMANYTKNVLVGCGGKSIIDKTHFLGAVYGMERLMGRDLSPVRQVLDYARNISCRSCRFTTSSPSPRWRVAAVIKGLFAGNERSCSRRPCS